MSNSLSLTREPESAFAQIDGTRLHYLAWSPDVQTSAADAIPLVLLHALAASADTWRLLANYLGEHPVVAFDLPGHGQNDPPPGGYDFTMKAVAEEMVRGMAALGLGQVALVAHGWGTRIALALAAHHPALVSHLVLVDGLHIDPKHWPGMTRERFIRQALPTEFFVARSAFLSAMQREMVDFWSPEVEAILLAHIRELPDGTVEERLRPAIRRRIREALWEDRALSYYSKVRCPVLLVQPSIEPAADSEPPEQLEHAEDFSLAKAYMALQVARAIRSCSILWLPQTAHDIQLHRPQLLARAIINFVQEQENV
jgi:pimeloyl-ACP methyl ester carboxylesterase